ncbi:MAG: hypothetical protein JSR47_11210 [Proteobacteria bacterium]|nr:hypothetical protein [Pseudomonadota bacterium]
MLSPTDLRDLEAFAGFMIPASTQYGVPGADDPAIFADIARSLERDTADVAAALKRLAAIGGKPFADLDAARRRATADTFRAKGGLAMTALIRVVLLCYYRDDRVMRSLGQEPRAPFPKGHVVEQGDWSLLDPVRQRAPIWRKVP